MIVDNRIWIISAFKSRRIHNQRLNRTSRLPVTLECTIQRVRIKILIPSTDNSHYISGIIVNGNSCSLHIVGAVIIFLCKSGKCIIYRALQLFLFIHINGGINFISTGIKLFLASCIKFIILLVVSFLFLIRIKIILEYKSLLLHQRTCCAIIGVRIHIIVDLVCIFLLWTVKFNIFLRRLVILFLCDFTIILHILKNQIPAF